MAELKAVLFDVDFTLVRPGPELGPEGYVRAGERHGLTLDASLYDEARNAALQELKRHPELEHDETIWYAFTERVVIGMGGAPPGSRALAVEITHGWERHEYFELYEDTLPVLAELRHQRLDGIHRVNRLSQPCARLRRHVVGFLLPQNGLAQPSLRLDQRGLPPPGPA